jgi:hypothetical protein
MERKIFWISFTVLGLAADFALVGSGRDHSHRVHLVVGGLPQRLV